jgi:uncharacterized protein YndB with AHSA1/START domain
MQVDVDSMIDAMGREVEFRDHDGSPARVVRLVRSYDTDIDDLWDAVTSGERIARWFLPITGDLRPGGSFQLEGNAGGTIQACEAPRYFAITWSMRGATSWVRVKLAAQSDDATKLELEHIAPADEMAQGFWDQFGPGAVGVGWDLALMGLALHIATGAANDRGEGAAWTASDAGRDFITRSSEDWGRASIAAGTDEAAATASAARTTAAYTGQPAPDAEAALAEE